MMKLVRVKDQTFVHYLTDSLYQHPAGRGFFLAASQLDADIALRLLVVLNES